MLVFTYALILLLLEIRLPAKIQLHIFSEYKYLPSIYVGMYSQNHFQHLTNKTGFLNTNNKFAIICTYYATFFQIWQPIHTHHYFYTTTYYIAVQNKTFQVSDGI